MTNVWIAILVAAVVSYAIRVLPLTLIRNAAIDIRSETSRDGTRNNRIFMRIRS